MIYVACLLQLNSVSSGTNTYIVGQQNPYILIDTGEGRDEFIPVLEKTLREIAKPINNNEADVSDIILSHRHHDHICGLASTLALLRRLWSERNPHETIPFRPPRIHKFPLPLDASDDTIDSVVRDLVPGSFTPSPNGSPFHDLHDDQMLPLAHRAHDGSVLSLRVLHTPGHTLDSISLYLRQDQALFTADSILGEGTAVFDNLTTYLASLRKMLDFHRGRDDDDETTHIRVLYPGHGPVVFDGSELIGRYIQHRLEREQQILDVLRRPPPGTSPEDVPPSTDPERAWTTWTIVSTIYSAYPEALWAHAARSVTLHLRKLEDDKRVRRLGGEGVNTRWKSITEL